MKKLVAFSVLALAIGLILSKSKDSGRALDSKIAGAVAKGSFTVAAKLTTSLEKAAKNSNTSKTSANSQPLALAVPREEAPQIVRDWSTDLGRNMLGAFKDEAKAGQMFSFLQTCAEDQSLAMVYRAVCAGNAKRLAEKFPERFSQNFGGFERGLPDRIQKFLAQAYTNF